MFRAMFSPIIRSTCLYLQHLVLFTQLLPAGVLDEFELSSNRSMTPAGSGINEYYQML